MSSQWKTTTKATAWTIHVTDQDGYTHRAGMIFTDSPEPDTFTAYTGRAQTPGRTYPSKASAIRYLRNAIIRDLNAQATRYAPRDLISAAMDSVANALDGSVFVTSCGAVDVTDWTDEDLADDYFDNA